MKTSTSILIVSGVVIVGTYVVYEQIKNGIQNAPSNILAAIIQAIKNALNGSTNAISSGYQTLQDDSNQYFSGAGPGNNIAASGGVDDINFPSPN